MGLKVGEHLRDFLGAREPASKKFLRDLLERELVSLSIQRGDDRVEAQEVADQRQMFAMPREFRLRECTDHDVGEVGDVAHVNDALLRIERQRPTHGPIRLLLRSHYAEQILIEKRTDE